MSRKRPHTRRRVLGALLAVSVVGVAAVVGVLVGPAGGSGTSSSTSAPSSSVSGGAATATATATVAAASLPAPASGFAVPHARQLGSTRDLVRWAPVLRQVWARRGPDQTAGTVAQVGTQSPEGTTNLLEADGEVQRNGVEWVRTHLAMLPNGTTGWVPRSALGGWTFVDTRVVIDRRALTLTLYRAGRQIFRTPVGVGKAASPTPSGTFYVRDRLTRYASPEYGPIAFGTTARSAVETDWPAGGFIGIHGTDEPSLIPGHISHGCVRLRNSAIRALARLMPVGTAVIIR